MLSEVDDGRDLETLHYMYYECITLKCFYTVVVAQIPLYISICEIPSSLTIKFNDKTYCRLMMTLFGYSLNTTQNCHEYLNIIHKKLI